MYLISGTEVFDTNSYIISLIFRFLWAFHTITFDCISAFLLFCNSRRFFGKISPLCELCVVESQWLLK
jgi:hypothetical protein